MKFFYFCFNGPLINPTPAEWLQNTNLPIKDKTPNIYFDYIHKEAVFINDQWTFLIN